MLIDIGLMIAVIGIVISIHLISPKKAEDPPGLQTLIAYVALFAFVFLSVDLYTKGQQVSSEMDAARSRLERLQDAFRGY